MSFAFGAAAEERDLGLQLSGVEEGGKGFGLDVTILKKDGSAFGVGH